MELDLWCCPSYWLRVVLWLLSFAGLLLRPANAGVVNRTIDDAFGDSETGQKPTFLPTTAKVWEDETCTGCLIQPDITKAFKNTFTAATYNPGLGTMSVEFDFEGIAVWVYFILANNNGDGITTLTAANFSINGGTPTLFQHIPDLTTKEIMYNQLAYSQTNLVNAKHTLLISTSTNTNVWVNFDYAIYTHDDDATLDPAPPPGGRATAPSSTSVLSTSISGGAATTATPAAKPSNSAQKQTSIAAIAGGTIAGIVCALGLSLLVVFFLRRRRRHSQSKSEDWTGENGSDPIIQPFSDLTTGPRHPVLSNQTSKYDSPTSQGMEPHNMYSNSLTMSSTEGGIASASWRITNPSITRTATTAGSTTTEFIRRERQRELDERMRNVQASMNDLAADITGRKPSRRRTGRGHSSQGEGEVEGDMTMEEMREQLRSMTNQVADLRRQQQSAWALGLSDDPPPGYTPAPS